MGKIKCTVSDATMVSARETGKYPCSICHKGVESNSVYTVTVAKIGFTRSAVILRVDCEPVMYAMYAMRIIGAESAQVKLEFMMTLK